MTTKRQSAESGREPRFDSKRLVSHIQALEERRLVNAEYQRGFMEGQQAAIKEFAAFMDGMLGRYDHVAEHIAMSSLDEISALSGGNKR